MKFLTIVVLLLSYLGHGIYKEFSETGPQKKELEATKAELKQARAIIEAQRAEIEQIKAKQALPRVSHNTGTIYQTPAQGVIYKWKDKNNREHFSNSNMAPNAAPIATYSTELYKQTSRQDLSAPVRLNEVLDKQRKEREKVLTAEIEKQAECQYWKGNAQKHDAKTAEWNIRNLCR